MSVAACDTGDVSPGQAAAPLSAEALTRHALRNAGVTPARSSSVSQDLMDVIHEAVTAALRSWHASQEDERQVPSQKRAATATVGGEGTSATGKARSGERHESSAAELLPHVLMEVPTMVGSFDPLRFYSDLLHELETHALRGGTAFGFGMVMKRVAKAAGLAVEPYPLPRPTRTEREELDWNRRQRRAV